MIDLQTQIDDAAKSVVDQLSTTDPAWRTRFVRCLHCDGTGEDYSDADGCTECDGLGRLPLGQASAEALHGWAQRFVAKHGSVFDRMANE